MACHGYGKRAKHPSFQVRIDKIEVVTTGIGLTSRLAGRTPTTPGQAQSYISYCTMDSAAHEEFITLVGMTTALGKTATFTIWPCWQCGHWRKERPVSSW